MKKFFQLLGFVTLCIFSFYYTEKTVSMVKEYDDIMVKIKEYNKEYKENKIDAKIDDDTIIPGLAGKEIDINKSYSKMRKYGKYDQKLLVYKNVLPDISIKDNYDKYIISGNKEKKEVSIVFKVDTYTNLKELLNILNRYDINVNFFIDGLWLEKNGDFLLSLIDEGHYIGNLSYNEDYKDSSFAWINTILKRIAKQNINFCYASKRNKEQIEICSLNDNYTIMPITINKEKPFSDVKSKIQNGSIITFDINDSLLLQLPNIIEYIKSRDLQIVTLDKIIDETSK